MPLPGNSSVIGADAEMSIARVKPDGSGILYEINFQGDGAVTDTIRLPDDGWDCISMSPDGSLLVLSGAGDKILFWSATTRGSLGNYNRRRLLRSSCHMCESTCQPGVMEFIGLYSRPGRGPLKHTLV